ncbi:NUDIX hydrolase [Streptomyces enissocaesilis]|uniref:NUDIX hydrolase n=1 Tax=Streptomyces enissocaesilis TaxID=332589 RepID=A0ABP6K108_9ACTN
MTGTAGAPDPRPVLAAGCVLWRRSPSDGVPRALGSGRTEEAPWEICLVHRPKYDDWSHPKGKLKSGEDARDAAVREVREETGMTCAPGPELPSVRYTADGRPKVVRYWAAEATGGSFEPNDEVDRVLWLRPDAAQKQLTRDRDGKLVAALLHVLRAAREDREERENRRADEPTDRRETPRSGV